MDYSIIGRRLSPSATQAALLLLPAMQARERDENLHVLRLTGEIDLSTSPELRARLQQQAKAKCPALVLDFSEVGYIDSSGLATIVEYMQHASAFNGRVALAHVNDRVRTIFELLRLHEFLPIHPTVAEAAAALRNEPSA
jgi:anti-sigma B factor antagonist